MLYQKIFHIRSFFMSKTKNASSLSQNKRKKSKSEQVNVLQVLVPSISIGIVVFFSTALIFSFILSKLSDPDSFFGVAAILMSVLCGMSCGITSCKITKTPMPYSLFCGLLMILLYLIISLFFNPSDFSTGMIFKTISVAALPVSSVLGAFSVRNKHKGRRKNK